MAAERPPCFLVLMADQLAASWLPVYGHPVVTTPYLSELAAGATVFDSAYTPFPLCAPARAAMLTGRYASEVGVYDNAAELRAGAPTVVHALRAAGYHTAVAGKMHFVGPDQLHGFEERLTTDIYPADVDWTPDWSRPLDEPLPWYHTMESVLAPGICAASMQTDYDEEVAFQARRKLYEIARHRAEEPFFLFVSFTNPHDPWEIPARHWDRYRRDQIDDPAVPALPLDTVDPHSRRLRAMCRVDEAGLTAEQIRRARHGYYAAVSYLDERVGEVLRALRDSGLQDRTTILFCADHGEMLGERGLWYKMNFYEPACRIPLIVHAPGRFAPRRVTGSASLLDLLPTFAALAHNGSEPEYAAPIDGRNLLPALEGHEMRDEVIGEYLGEGAIAPIVMIRRGRYKFVHCPVDPDQLYDVAADPDERVNLAGQANMASVIEDFRAEVARRWNLSQVNEEVLASQQRRHFVYASLRQGRFQPWDFQPIRDASRLYIRNDQELNDLESMARFPRLA
jgi:choline-sulfatase